MQAMEELMQGLPEGIAHEWSGQSFEERLSGAQAPALFALSVLIVFSPWPPSTKAGRSRWR